MVLSFWRCCLILATSVPLIAYGSGEAASRVLEQVAEDLLRVCEVPGMAVAVVAEGKVVYSQGFGLRDIKQNLPVTEKTLFSIASCTKPFTTFLVGELVAEGRLSWDDPVSSHLPQFAQVGDAPLTIRDLAAHRTGFPRHDAIWFCNQMGRQEVLACLEHLSPVCSPGAEWHYNNMMYSVLGLLIEQKRNLSWEETLQRRIFTPLRMDTATTQSDGAEVSLPYAPIGGVCDSLPTPHFSAVEPGGGITASVTDLAAWMQMLLSEETLIPKEQIEEMWTPQILCHLSSKGYGLGWLIDSYKGHRMVHHGGSCIGFRSEMTLLPDEKIGVIVLTNSSTGGHYACQAMRNALLDHELHLDETTDWVAHAKAEKESALQKLSLPLVMSQAQLPSTAEAYTGRFVHPAYGPITIAAQDGQLIAAYGNVKMLLYYREHGAFEAEIRELKLHGLSPLRATCFAHPAYGFFQEVHIALEPEDKPLVFKRAHMMPI